MVSTFSRIGGLPPEQVDLPIFKSFPDRSLAKGPDGRSAGPVTSLGRARLRLGLGARARARG